MKSNILKSVLFVFTLSATSAATAAPTVYIPLGAGNQVVAVDGANGTITGKYSGVENPHGLVITPDGEYLIAGSLMEEALKDGQPKDTPNSKLYLVHPVHGHVMSTIPVGGWTHHLAITPDGRYVVATHGSRGSVSIVDLENNKVSSIVKTGPGPNSSIVTGDGKHAYVSNTGSNSISEIDTSTWSVTRTLESGPGPEHMAFSADESIIFVSNARAGKVSAISVKTGKVAKEYKLAKSIHGLDIGADGKTLFVSSPTENKLFAIDTEAGTTKELPVSPAPYHLNSVGGTGKFYVSSSSKPIIWVVSENDFKVTGTIDLPAGSGHQIAVGQ